MDRWWQAFLRRFDLEHTFRLFKQTLGWTRPRLRDPAAGDRWTWLIIAAHAQSASPDRWSPTCADPGNAPPDQAGSPGPGPPRVSQHPPDNPAPRPAHPNPADPAPDAHPAPTTGTPRPATT